MMKNVLGEINGRYGDKSTLELLQWLMNVPVFANTIHKLTRIKTSSRVEQRNSSPNPNERQLFRLKKAMKKPPALMLRIRRQAKKNTNGKGNDGLRYQNNLIWMKSHPFLLKMIRPMYVIIALTKTL